MLQLPLQTVHLLVAALLLAAVVRDVRGDGAQQLLALHHARDVGRGLAELLSVVLRPKLGYFHALVESNCADLQDLCVSLQRVVDGRPAAARPGPGRQPRHLLVDVAELTQQRLHLGLDGLHRVLAPAAQQRGLVTVRVPDITLHLHYSIFSCEDIISSHLPLAPRL